MKYFVAGTTARTAADLVEIHRNTAVRFFHNLRVKIAQAQQNRSEQFGGKIELDESYFGGVRKGKRGRGAAGKVAVFGILKRVGKVMSIQDKLSVKQKLQQYVESDFYREHATGSEKSPYWDQHSSVIKYNVNNDTVSVTGSSGYTRPYNRNILTLISRNMTRIFAFIKNPSRSIIKLFALIFMKNRIHLIDHKNAFNNVMSGKIYNNGHIYCKHSPHHIDFDEFTSNSDLYQNLKDIEETTIYKKGFGINPGLLKSCYQYNMLRYILLKQELGVVVEIGAGSGNLMSLLKDNYPSVTVVDIDLPESIVHSVVYINELYPDARILLPHEELEFPIDEYDFIFRTPLQVDDIPDNSVDLSINTDSFMEMEYCSIDSYLGEVQRWSKVDSYLFSVNRVEKIPYSHDSIKNNTPVNANYEANYPWRDNETILLELDKFKRISQLDSTMVRVQKIVK